MSDTSAEPRATQARLRALYVCAVVVGPIAWVYLWLSAFGFRGVQLDAPAAIPGWLALALPPVIGLFLGWRLPLVERLRSRMMLAVSAPIAVVAFPYLIAEAGSILALLGLAVLYALGPIVLGRFLRLAWATVRK